MEGRKKAHTAMLKCLAYFLNVKKRPHVSLQKFLDSPTLEADVRACNVPVIMKTVGRRQRSRQQQKRGQKQQKQQQTQTQTRGQKRGRQVLVELEEEQDEQAALAEQEKLEVAVKLLTEMLDGVPQGDVAAPWAARSLVEWLGAPVRLVEGVWRREACDAA